MSADREKHRETLNQHLIQQINITIYQPWHHETWICSQNLNPNLSGCMNCKFQVVCHIKQPSGKSVISSSFLFAHMTLNNTDTTADWLTLTRSWVKGNTVMFWFCCSSFCRRTSKKNNLSTFRLNIHSLTYQGNVQNMYLLHVLCVHIACERLYAEKGGSKRPRFSCSLWLLKVNTVAWMRRVDEVSWVDSVPPGLYWSDFKYNLPSEC